MILAAFFNDLLTGVLLPARVATAQLRVSNPELRLHFTINDVLSPFFMPRVAAVGGLILTCPFWLYQA